jgi:hypothetical protein
MSSVTRFRTCLSQRSAQTPTTEPQAHGAGYQGSGGKLHHCYIMFFRTRNAVAILHQSQYRARCVAAKGIVLWFCGKVRFWQQTQQTHHFLWTPFPDVLSWAITYRIFKLRLGYRGDKYQSRPVLRLIATFHSAPFLKRGLLKVIVRN